MNIIHIKNIVLIAILLVIISTRTVASDVTRIQHRIGYTPGDSLLQWANIQLNNNTLTPNDRAQIYLVKMKCFNSQGNKDSAKFYINKFFAEIDQSHSEYKLLIEYYRNRSLVYRMSNKYDSAQILLHEALSLAKLNKDTVEIAGVNNDLGEFYRALRRYDKSKHYLREAINMLRNTKDRQLSRAYHRLAASYNETGSNDSAKLYSFKSLEISEQMEIRDHQAVSYNELGYIYKDIDAKLSEKYYEKAKKIWTYLNYTRYTASVTGNLTNLYIKKKEYNKALKEANELLKNSKKNQWFILQMDALRSLKMIYYLKQNYKKAYEYLLILMEVNDEYQELVYSEKLDKMESSFQIEQIKNKSLKNEYLLEVAMLNLQQEKQKKTFLIFSLSIFIGALLLLAYLFIKIRKQKSSLQQTNLQLNKSDKEKQILLNELHHRIKNTLTLLASLVKIQSTKYINAESKMIFSDLLNRIKSIAILYQDIYSTRNFEDLDLPTFFNNLFVNLKNSISNKKISFKIKSNNFNMETEKMIYITIILNELITNSLKHAFIHDEDGEIGIEFSENETKFILIYQDNGNGFDIANTGTEKSIGLHLINILTNQLKAEMQYSNNKHSRYTFEIPKSIM